MNINVQNFRFKMGDQVIGPGQEEFSHSHLIPVKVNIEGT